MVLETYSNDAEERVRDMMEKSKASASASASDQPQSQPQPQPQSQPQPHCLVRDGANNTTAAAIPVSSLE